MIYTPYEILLRLFNRGNNKMVGACGMYVGRQRCEQGFGGET